MHIVTLINSEISATWDKNDDDGDVSDDDDDNNNNNNNKIIYRPFWNQTQPFCSLIQDPNLFFAL